MGPDDIVSAGSMGSLFTCRRCETRRMGVMWFMESVSSASQPDIVLETPDGFNLIIRARRLLYLLLARSQSTDIPRSDTRRAISAWGIRDLDGKESCVGCPFGARSVCSAESGASTFAFFVCSDPTNFSRSGAAFHFPGLTAHFGGIVYEV